MHEADDSIVLAQKSALIVLMNAAPAIRRDCRTCRGRGLDA